MSFLHSDLLASAPFIEAERQLARALAPLATDTAARVLPFAAAWLHWRARQGASCVPLDTSPDWPADWPVRPDWPSRVDWESLAADNHPLIGGPDDYRPLIVEHGKLYLHRFRRMETDFANGLLSLAEVCEPRPGTTDLVRSLFADNAGRTPDLQRRAVYGALRRRFAVITGGPGTGKTTCVLKLLLALLAENPALSIALAAPTGKAAARLNESLAEGVRRLRANPVPGLSPELLGKIPGDARTLHKLLGITPATPEGNASVDRHVSGADVVVVDEASMIPLPIMAMLVRNLGPRARLILLGDRDQLASVDLGSVLGDIVAAGESLAPSPSFLAGCAALEGTPAPAAQLASGAPQSGGLLDAVHRLTHTYRFKRDEVVGCFCLALQENKPDDAIGALGTFDALKPPLNANAVAPAPDSLESVVAGAVREHFQKLAVATDSGEALAALNRFRLLCSHRVGPFGVEEVNRLAHRKLGRRPGDLFAGLPMIITQNTPELDLWNGDCGVFLNDPTTGLLQAYFPAATGASAPRAISPAKLPHWEPAFAMSIHKSQGSEFDAVTLVLPPDDSPLLTRELLYTGASRAKKSLTLHAAPALLKKALSRTVSRPSGLGARLG